MLGLGLALTLGSPVLGGPGITTLTYNSNDSGDRFTAFDFYQATLFSVGDFAGGEILACAQWNSVAVVSGTVLTSATVKVTVSGVTSGGTPYLICFQNVDNGQDIVTVDCNAWASITGTVSVAKAATTGVLTFDVKSILQTVINRAGWASGNRISMRIKANPFTLNETIVFDDSYGAVMTLTFPVNTSYLNERFQITNGRTINFFPFNAADLAQSANIRSIVTGVDVTLPVAAGPWILRGTPRPAENVWEVTTAAAETSTNGDYGRPLFGPDDGIPWRYRPDATNHSFLLVCSCKYLSGVIGWYHDVLGFDDWALQLTEGNSLGATLPVGRSTTKLNALVNTDTSHIGLCLNSTQSIRAVAGETHRFALFYNHTNDTLYLAFDNGLGTLEQVTGGTIAATDAASIAGGATGYLFDLGMKYFGCATFEFTTPPADWFTAVDWMTKQWSIGNKALYPGWRA